MHDFDLDDRRGWEYSENPEAIQAAIDCYGMLTGDLPFDDQLFTPGSRETWRSQFAHVDPVHYRQLNLGASTKVRHPAPGMAYVFLLPIHPDHTEKVVITEPTRATVYPVTLMRDDAAGRWQVHAFGEFTPPAALGLEQYPRSTAE